MRVRRQKETEKVVRMDQEKLNHFRSILLNELKRHTQNVADEQATAQDGADDGVKDSVDMSLADVNKEIAFRLGERESKMVAEIDQALLRMDEGTYGICERCGKVIDERRLEAVPTARYDAVCQAIIEKNEGFEDPPTL
jgi:DnaK suppressor protein